LQDCLLLPGPCGV